MVFVCRDQDQLLRFGTKIPDTVFIQVMIVQQDEGHRGLRRHLRRVDPYFRLNSPGVEGPKIGGLLNLVVLMQALSDTRNVQKVPIHVQLICRASTDLSVDLHHHE